VPAALDINTAAASLVCPFLPPHPHPQPPPTSSDSLSRPPVDRIQHLHRTSINRSFFSHHHNNHRYHEVLCCPHLRRRDHCRGPEHVRPPPVRRKFIPRSTVHVSCIARSKWRDTTRLSAIINAQLRISTDMFTSDDLHQQHAWHCDLLLRLRPR
jgi:hypothetical protein